MPGILEGDFALRVDFVFWIGSGGFWFPNELATGVGEGLVVHSSVEQTVDWRSDHGVAIPNDLRVGDRHPNRAFRSSQVRLTAGDAADSPNPLQIHLMTRTWRDEATGMSLIHDMSLMDISDILSSQRSKIEIKPFILIAISTSANQLRIEAIGSVIFTIFFRGDL